MQPSFYEILNVPPTASYAEIRAAYLSLVRKLHPDVNPHPDAEAVMRLVNDAWSVLGDDKRRAAYDADVWGFPTSTAGAAPWGDGWSDGYASDYSQDWSSDWSPQADDRRSPLHGRLSQGITVLIVILILLIILSAYAGPTR
jgi:curved DNA-binding protein CbpA